MPTAGVAVESLGKDYAGRAVVDQLFLDVAPGRVLALLGPNGAGKTTVIRILATLTRPDRGRAMVGGHDVVVEPGAVRTLISLSGQFAAIDSFQTGRETLTMLGRLRDLPRSAARRRADELLEMFDLWDAADDRVATYSGGMRRRLDLAATLVVKPAVLFLDEPTTGLDPRSRRALWDVVGGLKASGTTILLTTQYLEEADRLADQVVLLDAGRVAAQGTPTALKARVSGSRLDLVLTDDAAFDRTLESFKGRLLHADPQLRTVAVATNGRLSEIRSLLDDLARSTANVEFLSVSPASLDDVFLAHTGDAADSRETAHHG